MEFKNPFHEKRTLVKRVMIGAVLVMLYAIVAHPVESIGDAIMMGVAQALCGITLLIGTVYLIRTDDGR